MQCSNNDFFVEDKKSKALFLKMECLCERVPLVKSKWKGVELKENPDLKRLEFKEIYTKRNKNESV